MSKTYFSATDSFPDHPRDSPMVGFSDKALKAMEAQGLVTQTKPPPPAPPPAPPPVDTGGADPKEA